MLPLTNAIIFPIGHILNLNLSFFLCRALQTSSPQNPGAAASSDVAAPGHPPASMPSPCFFFLLFLSFSFLFFSLPAASPLLLPFTKEFPPPSPGFLRAPHRNHPPSEPPNDDPVSGISQPRSGQGPGCGRRRNCISRYRFPPILPL